MCKMAQIMILDRTVLMNELGGFDDKSIAEVRVAEQNNYKRL